MREADPQVGSVNGHGHRASNSRDTRGTESIDAGQPGASIQVVETIWEVSDEANKTVIGDLCALLFGPRDRALRSPSAAE